MNKKRITYLVFLLAISIPVTVNAACSTYCSRIFPVVRIVKNIIMPIIQIALPIILIILSIIDLAKASTAGKEDDVKAAQKLLIKRIIYGLVIFFVVAIVKIVMGLIGQNDETNEKNWLNCYNHVDECDYSYTNPGNSGDDYGNDEQQPESPEEKPDSKSEKDNSSAAPTTGVIYIGDSRTNGMCGTCGLCNGPYIAEQNMGAEWLNNTAIPQLETRLSSNSNINVVIMLGVNDLYAVSTYISTYNTLAQKHTSTKFIIVSVTQVDKSKYHGSATNNAIADFNTKLKSGLSGSNIKYCDVHSAISSTITPNTADGLHYTCTGYGLVYNAIKNCL